MAPPRNLRNGDIEALKTPCRTLLGQIRPTQNQQGRACAEALLARVNESRQIPTGAAELTRWYQAIADEFARVRNSNWNAMPQWQAILKAVNALVAGVEASMRQERPDLFPKEVVAPPIPNVWEPPLEESALPPAGPSNRGLARLIAGGADAVLTVSTIRGLPGALTKPGALWRESGAFIAPQTDDDPWPEALSFGPFPVAAGGAILAAISGFPPVPNRWSLGNNNAALSIWFEPLLGASYGPASEILKLVGATTNNQLSGQASWRGPGRLSAAVFPARGGAPLGGVRGCFFDQKWKANIKIQTLDKSGPALCSTCIYSGDTLQTHGEPALIELSSRLIVEPYTTIAFTARGRTTLVRLQAGGVRYVHTLAAGDKRASALAVQTAAGHIIQAAAGDADYIVRQREDGGTVYVLEGQVSLTRSGGKKLLAAEGQQCDLSEGKLSAYKHDPSADCTIGGLPATHILLPSPPVPPATFGLHLTNDKFSDGWVWEDPGQDALVTSPTRGVLKITVPDGNDLWVGRSDAPRLLHPVSGDFDLSGDLLLSCKSNNFASAEFLLYAPGEYLGYHARQMNAGAAAAHYLIIGGGWLKMEGLNKLPSHGTPYANRPDAPRRTVKFLLTRRKDLWRTYWSLDGKRWNLGTRQVLAAPDDLWVGWLFKRRAYDGTSAIPAITTLSKVKLQAARRGSLPSPAWDVIQWSGAAEVHPKTIAMRIDGSQTGTVSAISGQPIKGDFEFIVHFTTTSWRHQPGQTRSLYIFADAGDGQNETYIRQTQSDTFTPRIDTDLRKNGSANRYQWKSIQADQGTFRLLRRGDVITTYYKADGKWERLDRFDTGFAAPVYLGIALDTTERASKPTTLAAEFKIEKLAARSLIVKSRVTRDSPNTGRQKPVPPRALQDKPRKPNPKPVRRRSAPRKS